MNNYLRNSSIVRIMAILDATAPRFEEFGQHFMNYLLTTPLLHRGLNVLGHSVGYSVDSYTSDGRIVAQYSAERGYFSGMAEKPFDDILHSLRMKNETTDVFLISLGECKPLEEERIRKRLVGLPGFAGRTYHFFDRRRIAEYIVDNLLIVDQAVNSLANYMHQLREVADEHTADLLVPTISPSYKYRDEVDNAIAQRLVSEKCLFLYGIAGMGKSQAAAAYAKANSLEFEIVVWTDGTTFKDINALHSLAVGRAGVSRNVSALLRTRRCLLVIDDLSIMVERELFAQLCGDRSRVIITQREKTKDGFALPLMEEHVAKTVLTNGISDEIHPVAWKKIFAAVGGHPLSLGLMNGAVKEGANWSDIVDDCDSIGDYVDSSHERLVDRLLKRFQNSLGKELRAIKWLGSKELYRPLLRELIGPVGVRKLEAYSLVAPSRQSVVRLHDIVFSALNSANWIDEAGDDFCLEKLDKFLTTSAQSPTIDLKAAALLHQRKLQALIREGAVRPSFVYAMLQTWRPEDLDRQLVEDPSDVLTRLEQQNQRTQHIQTAVVIESIESLYRADKELDRGKGKKDPKVALQNLASRLPLYDRLAAIPNLSTLQHAELLHHKGKTLSITGDVEGAKRCFEEVLAGQYPMYETRLQLVRVLSRLKMRPEAIEQAKSVLEAASAQNVVSTSVLLATICAVPSGPERDLLMETYAEVLEREILLAADAGLDQAFEALLAVSRSWRYVDPARLKNILSAVDLPNPHDDKSRATLAEIFQSAAHVHPDEEAHFLERALSLYEEIIEWEDFWRQQYAEALISSEKCTEALAVLNAMQKETPWSHYHRSKALLKTDETELALQSIELAIQSLPSTNANFLAPFLAQRFEVRLVGKDAAATDDIEAAIREATTDQYREQLRERLMSLTSESSPAEPTN